MPMPACRATTPPARSGARAENFSVTPSGGTMQWAVSQAAPFRRMHILGNLVLHQHRGWASGGWMSDTLVDGIVDSGSQQQWIARNSQWGNWTGANWNMVFVGDVNRSRRRLALAAVHQTRPPSPSSAKNHFSLSTRAETILSALPALRHNSSGITWRGGVTPGQSIPLSRFFIAHPGDTAAAINAQLAARQKSSLHSRHLRPHRTHSRHAPQHDCSRPWLRHAQAHQRHAPRSPRPTSMA